MNLLLVNYEYPPIGGGAGNATQALGRAFASQGHRVRVLTSGLGALGSSVSEDGLDIVRLPVGRRLADRAKQAEMLRFLLRSRAAAAELARGLRPDGVIAFFTIPSGPAALRLRRLHGTPYVVSLRGGDVPGHVPGLGLKHLLTRPLRRAVLRHAAAIVANSESLAAASRAADPYPARVIPNGVDCARFRPAEAVPGRAPGGRLLFVGRVHPEKNLDAVLRQMAALPPPGRAQVRLTVAGDGAHRPKLELLAAELGIAGRVEWLGWQPKAALPELYRSADILVNPSQYEGMPNAVLEAMASGLPVVASDVPGNRSVIEPERTGVLFPPAQPGLLGAALQRLVSDPERAKALGRAGRARAEADFSWTRAAQSYLELLGHSQPSLSPS